MVIRGSNLYANKARPIETRAYDFRNAVPWPVTRSFIAIKRTSRDTPPLLQRDNSDNSLLLLLHKEKETEGQRHTHRGDSKTRKATTAHIVWENARMARWIHGSCGHYQSGHDILVREEDA